MSKIYILIFSFFILVFSNNFAQEQQPINQTGQSTQVTQTPASPASSQAQTPVEAKPATSQSQTSTVNKQKPFADELNIGDQFNYAIDKSSNFQDYKVIKQAWVTKLKANTLDTLAALKSNLNTVKDQLNQKTETIEGLRAELTNAQTEILEKNSFSLIGIMLSKAAYDSIMWSIIIGLFVALGFLAAAFKRSYSVTAQTKKDLNEAKEEFESYRKKALKSKEEAVRQLYDEINKYKNKK